MPKDAKKKIWEKERRDHLKEAFLKLEKLLPSYDPSITASRIEVLTKSIEYIQEMKNLIQEFSKSQSEMNPKVLKFKNLQDRIKRLVSRMEIMNRLLREAKIPIPSARSWKEFKHKNYKWSGKINEVKDTVIKPILTKKKSTGDKCKNNSDIEPGNKFDLLSKHRKSPMNKKRSEQKPLQPSTSKCVIIYTQAYNTSPCYLVSSTLSNNLSGSQTVSTNSVQASNPSIALNVKESGNSSTPSNSKIQSLGGTLILTNGSLYPILQQPKPILPSSMLLQVNDNSDKNDANIKQKVRGSNKIVDGQKKNLDGNSNKNSISKKSNLKTTNGTVKNSSRQMKPKLSPNLLPLGSNISMRKNSYLLPSQMNPILIPNSSDILRPKVSFTGISKRRAVGKRIGDKPVSRQALKRIGKLARQKELEARKKIEHNPTISNTLSNNENEMSSQKNPSNIKDTEMSSVQEVNEFNEQKSDRSTDKKEIQDLDAQKSISIISDEVIRESSQNIFTMDTEQTPIITQVSKTNNTNENMPEKKAKEEISIGEVSKEETKLLNNSDKTEQILKQNSIHLEKSNCPNETEIIPEKQNENENSKNVESTENLNSCGNELQNMDSEQIIQTENNSDLENVCNVNQQLKNLDIHLGHSELSNDLFASLQVPPGCQNPESTSPTAAFLLAFPLVSSLTGVKVTEVIDEENPDSQRETPTLLQIGTMDTNKSGQSENFNSNLLNLDFFSSKDIYGGFYNSFEHLSGLSVLQTGNVNENLKGVEKHTDNSKTSISYHKPSINMGNIQPSHTPKQSTTSETNATTENVPGNVVYSSSNIDCQPRFLFDEKQASSICLYEKDKTQIIPTETYSDKSIEQYSQGKKSQNKNDNNPIEDAKKRNDDAVNHLPQSMNQNFQTKVEFIKDSVSQNKSSSKGENSFLRIESCDNIFNAGGISNNNSKGCEHDVSMNFYPEKQKLLMSDHFNTQDINTKNKNVASLHQENMHNVQIPSMVNKNFVPSSINSNQVGSGFNIDINTSYTSKNMNSLTKEVNSFSNTEIQPYFLQDKNYQSISNQINSKSSNLEVKNTETSKYINYGNFISDPKKSLKDNDLNADFNLESKISIGKITNSKDITCNFNMGYPNSAYDINSITKNVTCAYNSGKPPSDPLYTNSNNHTYNYYSNSDNYMSEVCYKNSKIDKNPVSEAEIFTNYKRTDYNAFYTDNPRKVISCSKAENIQDKSTYNWMTTPAKPSNVISNFQKDDIIYSNTNLISGNQNNYFNPVSTYTTEFTNTLNQTSKKTFDLPLANINYQKSEIEDGQNQFSWSPTKMPQFLDPVPSFVSSTLPTLVGDLALGSSNLMDQKYEFANKSSKDMKNKVSSRSSYDSNQSNFLSVSQLVHQNDKNVPGKPSRRRNSGGASKNSQLKNKKVIKSNEDAKTVSQCYSKPLGNQVLPKIENKSYNCRQMGNINCEKRNSQKVNSSIYSAEALISQHSHSENSTKKDQKFPGNTMKNVPVPPYLPDNIMPYFPTVDLQQENMQQNQNYQNFPSFTTFSNNSYSTNNFIPSSSTTPYISSSSFASDVGVGNEVSSENINIFPGAPISKIKLTTKNREEKNDSNNACTNISIKKVKRKPSNEISAASNLVDFSFLSVPGSIHSPILPDDFHTHTAYLPPPPPQPQLYPCKNTFYPTKQSTIPSTGSLLPIPPLSSVTRSGLQHPDVSPSLNSVGTSSLTNFNLSTIFPEINKSSMGDIYTGSQSKDQTTNKHFSNSAIPFNTKPPFTYPSCPITQPYEIDNR